MPILVKYFSEDRQKTQTDKDENITASTLVERFTKMSEKLRSFFFHGVFSGTYKQAVNVLWSVLVV